MTCQVKAIPTRCGCGCLELCVEASPAFGAWGKFAQFNKDNPEHAGIWAECLKAKKACERDAIVFKDVD